MINNPVCYSSQCRAIVEKFNSLKKSEKDPKYWNSVEIEAIRKEIKQHYKDEQKYICSYCRQQIKVEHSMIWDIEHIVAKSSHPQFMFEPKNLCLACKDCNVNKGAQNVLKKEKTNKYPTGSEEFYIIHPHFDRYTDHITKLGENVFVPRTEKGIFTANCCGLFRFSLESAGWNGQIAKSPKLLEAANEIMSLDTDKIKSLEIKIVEDDKTKSIEISF